MKQENQKEISICALTLDPYGMIPGQRFRIEQWEPYLKEEGITIDYFPFTDTALKDVLYQKGKLVPKLAQFSKAMFRRVEHVLAAAKYDVVLIYRAAAMIGPAFFERFLHWRKLPIIFDFDDAIFLTHTSTANERFGWAKFSGKTATICRLSTSVTVGNAYLAEYARNYNDNVYVVPTSIDTNRYFPAQQTGKNKERTIIGWTGSSTSQYYLEAFEPTLAEIMKKRGNEIELRVISDREPNFSQIPHVWRKWSASKEVEETSQIDIGIMPTPDDDWARGKCAAKALQYMGLGIPAVCSDVGANRDVIKHGENGFLARTPEQWLSAIETLIDNPKVRADFGIEARKTVVEHYSMERCAKLFAEVVRKTVEMKKNKSYKE